MRFRTKLRVDLNILGENLDLLRVLAPHNDIIFMIKANAYGHGMVPLARYAITELNIKEFGLASLGEAAKLREDIPDLEFEVYVFSDTQIKIKECASIYLDHRIVPVISSLESLDFFIRERSFSYLPLCIKLNTGMNRLGIPVRETDQIVDLLKRAGRRSIHHLFSHFALSGEDILNSTFTQKQYALFKESKKFLSDSSVEIAHSSIANSGAIEQKFALEESHIRPGLMLYGPSAVERSHRSWKAKTVSRLETYIIHTFDVLKGEPLGYGGYAAPSDGKVALIALGYGDGFGNIFSGAEIIIKGLKGNVFARVNMDMAQIFFDRNVGDLSQIQSGEAVIIWDHTPSSLAQLGDKTSQIPYEIFCRISSRIPRIYGYNSHLCKE